MTKINGWFRKTYRFYDPLVDAAFYVMILIILYGKGLRFFISREEILALPTTPAFFVIFQVAWFVMLFLFIARFMRDEFAQKIWMRTSGTFAYFVVLIPFLAVSLAVLFGYDIYLWFEAGGEVFDDRLDTPPPGPIDSDPRDLPQFLMFYGVVEFMVELTTWALILFFAIYKYFRWREG